MARPSKLTSKTVNKLAQALATGAFIATACSYAGISTSLFYAWKARGKREKERLERRIGAKPKPAERPFLEFLDAVVQAELKAELRALTVVNRVALGGEVTTGHTLTKIPVKVNGVPVLDPDGQPVYAVEETTIRSAVPPDWRAAAWFLERRWPERWGRRHITVAAKITPPPVPVTLEEWRRGFERRRKALEAKPPNRDDT